MIKIELMDKNFIFFQTLGEFKPNEVNDVINLIQVYGVMYNQEMYYYHGACFDKEINSFSIIVDKK